MKLRSTLGIESVFSGMKKAVIANSDYASEDEMKTAVAQHFEEELVFRKKSQPSRK